MPTAGYAYAPLHPQIIITDTEYFKLINSVGWGATALRGTPTY